MRVARQIPKPVTMGAAEGLYGYLSNYASERLPRVHDDPDGLVTYNTTSTGTGMVYMATLRLGDLATHHILGGDDITIFWHDDGPAGGTVSTTIAERPTKSYLMQDENGGLARPVVSTVRLCINSAFAAS